VTEISVTLTAHPMEAGHGYMARRQILPEPYHRRAKEKPSGMRRQAAQVLGMRVLWCIDPRPARMRRTALCSKRH
jgi:hypothetical protein